MPISINRMCPPHINKLVVLLWCTAGLRVISASGVSVPQQKPMSGSLKWPSVIKTLKTRSDFSYFSKMVNFT